MRHSTAHVLAQAVKRLYPEAKFGVGPVIDNGFYYDIELDESLTPEDLPKIEKEMERIVNENLEFTREVVSREEAREMFEKIDVHLKLELDRKSTRLNSSHVAISYAVFCLKKKITK